MDILNVFHEKLQKVLALLLKHVNHLNQKHCLICIMHWFFLIQHMVFMFGERRQLFIYIDCIYFRKKNVRIICGVPPKTHTDPLYKDLKILNIDQIRDYFITLFIYKLSHHMLPSMVENMFIYTSDVHDYYTRQADLLYFQYAPTNRSQRTIKYYGTKSWNIISGIIQPDCAISTFKQKLQIFFLSWLGSFSLFNFKLCVFSFYFILFLFFSIFSWLLTKWYPPALCTCSCSPCFNEFAVLIKSLLLPPLSRLWLTLLCFTIWRFFVMYHVLALLILWI